MSCNFPGAEVVIWARSETHGVNLSINPAGGEGTGLIWAGNESSPALLSFSDMDPEDFKQ
jgi:hypothetical protein